LADRVCSRTLFNGTYQWSVLHAGQALRLVSLEDYARTLDVAIARLSPQGIPIDESVYDDAVENLYDPFEESDLAEEFDDPFEVHEESFWTRYNTDETEFRHKLHAYIVANRSGFTEA
jgi:hypothetical protein